MPDDANLNELNLEVQAIWDQNAEWWDDYIGPEGNAFHRTSIGPATERLLAVQPNELILDIACGNGQFARRMADLGAQVVACDFSEKFLERARRHSTGYADRIEYSLVDATDESQLAALGEGHYDAAVCTMALMDMATIDPLAGALPKLLKPGGRFVFSVTHPCFNSTGVRHMAEEEDRAGELVTTYSIKVVRYLGLGPSKGLGIVGQPVPQTYFERTLSLLFTTFFRAGLVLDGLEEPPVADEVQPNRPLSWANIKEIPPVLVARMRHPS